jgi:hypothetical protein
VGAHLNVQWSDSTVPALGGNVTSRQQAYQQLADSISIVKADVSPSLIFIISDEMKPKKKSKNAQAQPTIQQKNSERAWIELFQTAGDYSVFIPGRFYNIVKVDATTVKADKNKYLCSSKAPIVLLTKLNGEVVSTFESQAKIKRIGVVRGMTDILRKEGTIASTSPFDQLNLMMRALKQSEFSILKLNKKLAELDKKLKESEGKDLARAKKSGKPIVTSRSTLSAESAIDKFEATILHAAAMKRYGVFKTEYALLQTLKLPENKLPPEPVEPESGDRPKTTGKRR